MPDFSEWFVPVLAVLGSLTVIFMMVMLFAAGVEAAGKDRQLAEVRRLLAWRQAQVQWLTERVQQLVQQAEEQFSSQEQVGGRLHLDQDGRLHEDDHGRL